MSWLTFRAKCRWKGGWRWAGWVLSGLCLLLTIYLAFLYVMVTDRFEGKRWRLPSKLYSDSFILYSGQDLAGIHLPDRLRRLGYREVPAPPRHPGEYHVDPGRLLIFLNDFLYPDHAFRGFPVQIALENGRIKEMTDFPLEDKLALVELEPELIAAFFNEAWEERDLVRLEELPHHLIEAVLSVEDTRFYQHAGIDPRSIARALWVNLKNMAIVQGGSTVTQQLVKNFYLNQERTLTRKLNEVFMALLLEMRYSKEEILEAYLNEIYMGQSGTMGIYGMGQASRFYFGKRAQDLTLGESVLLAGMIKSPNLYSPFHDPDRAGARKEWVLERMLKLGKISRSEYHRALADPIPNNPPVEQKREAPYFVDFVRQQLGEHYSPEALTSEGLRIFTTLDMQQQHLAEEALVDGLEGLERRYPHLRREDPGEKLQGCLIALQPQTGHIKAMVGGREYEVSQFNRATQARRQPGSLFKPFVYAAALTQVTAEGLPYTAASLIEDAPMTLTSKEGSWNPQNYDKTFHGAVTLRTALENSLNVATVRLAQDVGMDRVIDMAQAMGIRTPLKNIPSLALGASEVIPLEIAMGYATIANGGVRVEPLAIKEVVDATGRVLERRTLEMMPVLTPQQAFLLTYLLQGVVDRGTASAIRTMGFSRPAAGKTGTTSNYKDTWFMGFTPDLLSLVWVGFDGAPSGGSGGGELRLTGALAALPIWTDFMKQATAGLPVSRFLVPPGIVFEKIDPKSGFIADKKCPGGIKEAFLEGTQPRRSCGGSEWSPKGFFRWLRRLI